MNLVEFLRARLGEDELESQVNPVRPYVGGWHRSGCDTYAYDPQACDCGLPARMLAEVEAKRLVLADHPNLNADWGPPGDEYAPRPVCARCEDRERHDALAWPCPTLRALALPYAGHPDYRLEWKP